MSERKKLTVQVNPDAELKAIGEKMVSFGVYVITAEGKKSATVKMWTAEHNAIKDKLNEPIELESEVQEYKGTKSLWLYSPRPAYSGKGGGGPAKSDPAKNETIRKANELNNNTIATGNAINNTATLLGHAVTLADGNADKLPEMVELVVTQFHSIFTQIKGLY